MLFSLGALFSRMSALPLSSVARSARVMLLLLSPGNLALDDCWLLTEPDIMSSLSELHRVLLTEQLAELVEDVNPGLAPLLQQEGGAPGSVGQGGQARHEVSSRLLRLLELLGSGVGGHQEDGSDHQSGKESSGNVDQSVLDILTWRS